MKAGIRLSSVLLILLTLTISVTCTAEQELDLLLFPFNETPVVIGFTVAISRDKKGVFLKNKKGCVCVCVYGSKHVLLTWIFFTLEWKPVF